MDPGLAVAVVLGLLQGILEWLPVSSEGLVSIVVAGLGAAPAAAVALSLFLHVGTAVAAGGFYRGKIAEALAVAPAWRPGAAFADRERADLTFLSVATLVSGVTGVGGYVLLDEVVTALTGGVFLALVGGLLVVTGLLQRYSGMGTAAGDPTADPGTDPPASEAYPDTGDGGSDPDGAPGIDAPRRDGGSGPVPGGDRKVPDLVDAVLVGALQGLAVLPGISRSGTTASALLLRGHDGERSLELSFLLSVPAALGAGAIVVLEADGIPAIAPVPALVALAVAAVVGYATIDALTRLVGRLPFWSVCTGLGALGVAGGVLAMLL